MGILDILWQERAQVTVALLVLYCIRLAVIYNKLRRFKGPPFTGVSGWPHTLALMTPSCHEWYQQVNEKYGKIVRIEPTLLMTSSAEVWTQVNLKPGYKRSDWWYNAVRIEHRRDNVFSQTDNDLHDLRRKQMAPGYSGRENKDLEPAVDSCVERFVALLRNKYMSTDSSVKPMDMAKKVQFFTLDVISALALGKSFGMLAEDRDVDEYIASSEEGLRIGTMALTWGFSWVTQVPWLGKFIAPSPSTPNGFGRMMAACFKAVDERAANPTDSRSDMLASFIRHGLTGDELRSEALEQIIAGSDTVASGIRGALLFLMTNPRVYAKLQEEIDAVVAAGKVSGVVSLAQGRQMPYLQAVIREALRLWPPAANIFPRDVPAGGDTVVVDGKEFFLPAGCCIGYSSWAMQRSKETYGPDAHVFRPERWFEEEPDKLAAMIRTNDLTFGYGRWHCLGKPVAQLELNKLLFALFQNFDFALVNPLKPWKATNLLGLFAIENMWVQVTERSH